MQNKCSLERFPLYLHCLALRISGYPKLLSCGTFRSGLGNASPGMHKAGAEADNCWTAAKGHVTSVA